jgi:uncharacterized RDD family membrane protein YckC
MYCSKCGANVPDNATFCSACGQPTGVASGAPNAGAPGSGYASGIAMTPAAVTTAPVGVATAAVRYAGFWLRFVAAIIDYVLLGIPLGVMFFLLVAKTLPTLIRMQGRNPNPMELMFTLGPRMIAVMAMSLVIGWLYWAGLQASSWQATLGKKALGLYVTDLSGHRVTFGKASGRFFAGRGIAAIVPSIGGLYFIVSCILAGITEKKQALHDIIAGTLVLRKV